ncbi:uncharacterized protein L199_001155 [Kwoniella botswanensis]|uniref:uncharacterized protein n=1 Tax=Kwoniella botswanensis TaxID=1268659 RepID=UPI00315D6E42
MTSQVQENTPTSDWETVRSTMTMSEACAWESLDVESVIDGVCHPVSTTSPQPPLGLEVSPPRTIRVTASPLPSPPSTPPFTPFAVFSTEEMNRVPLPSFSMPLRSDPPPPPQPCPPEIPREDSMPVSVGVRQSVEGGDRTVGGSGTGGEGSASSTKEEKKRKSGDLSSSGDESSGPVTPKKRVTYLPTPSPSPTKRKRGRPPKPVAPPPPLFSGASVVPTPQTFWEVIEAQSWDEIDRITRKGWKVPQRGPAREVWSRKEDE